jgi:hypothetical protein
VVNDVEHSKLHKYSSLSATYYFVPITAKILNALGNEASAFFLEIGSNIALAIRESRSTNFVIQRVNAALQPAFWELLRHSVT